MLAVAHYIKGYVADLLLYLRMLSQVVDGGLKRLLYVIHVIEILAQAGREMTLPQLQVQGDGDWLGTSPSGHGAFSVLRSP